MKFILIFFSLKIPLLNQAATFDLSVEGGSMVKEWLKIATNDISIQEFINVMPHYKSHFLVPLIQPF